MRRQPQCALGALALLFAIATHAAQKEPQCGGVSGDPALAIQVCTRAIEYGSLERPELAKAYHARGAEWATQGNHERAIADFDLALELDPKLDAAYYNRALSHSHRGETERAIADYDVAIKLRPGRANPHVGRAAEWVAKGDYKRAIADYDQATRIEPQLSSLYFGRARARFYAGEFMSAASDFYRAHQIEPSAYSALWLYLARKRADIAGEKTLAQDAGMIGGRPWPGPVIALYLGTGTPDSVLRAATHPDSLRQRELRCEASFYVAQWHILRSAREPALNLLREAESICPRTFIEREGAVSELRRLQSSSGGKP
ncbi:MAG: tetratricopeptide repeat protein [Pseudomonadota bacterium]